MDYVQTDLDMNAEKVCLHGFSRFGKAAIWAGAQDPRFAITFSGESGLRSKLPWSAAASARQSKPSTAGFRTGSAEISKKYNDNVNALPV